MAESSLNVNNQRKPTENNKFIDTLLQNYREMRPISLVLSDLGQTVSNLSNDKLQEFQQEFCDIILNDPQLLKFPPSKKYTKKLLQFLINEVDSRRQVCRKKYFAFFTAI